MYTITIRVATELAAKSVQEQIAKAIPTLDGQIRVTKDPEIQPLSEIIKSGLYT